MAEVVLTPEVWLLNAEQATEIKRARGEVVATNNPKVNLISELFRGYQDRPADERAKIDEVWRRISDPCWACKEENATLREEIARLKEDR